MQAHKIPLFKHWVSEGLARAVIFAILMTSLCCFALYSSPVTIMGFYGIDATAMQYGMVVIYGSTVTFLALDVRIVKRFASRGYLLLALAINGICTLICFYSRNWTVFLIGQFLQGMTCALLSGIVLNLIFPRLESTRAKVIGYTILYAGIQISVPLYAIFCSAILYVRDFNWLFYGIIILLILLGLTVLITMHPNARLHKKLPLYQVDWIGYIYYTYITLALGYILVYGQQLDWLDNPYIKVLSLILGLVLILFVLREMRLKRPLIDLRIFGTKNFVLGLLLLVIFYLFKGSTGLTYSYVENVLATDSIHTIPLWLAVIAGTLLSMFVTARFVLSKTNLMQLMLVGFMIMAMYYGYMLLFVSVAGETLDFILPMFIYGLATGALFVPIVFFTASAAPQGMALYASLLGIFARFVGFCSSIALNNQLQLYTKGAIREKLRETLIETNPLIPSVWQDIQNTYINAGNDMYVAKNASDFLFNKLIKQQLFARAVRDYYDVMFIILLCVIITLLLAPRIRNVVLKLRKDNIPY
ncbi:MFS transporter [Sphingobacterium prati]|uniref:MFS transporter n=1 Tax=Sphingobacterium prati TaxID=2737006 RepID=UPI0015561A00|nr:MFS transporter [Sphingobacterium prati]NPE46841.1 MFS transporter [Sphingobacterium prati]